MPESEEQEVVTDCYHGTAVSDPYRWLEGDGAEVRNWIASQGRRCAAYFAEQEVSERLSAIEPGVRERLAREVVTGPIVVRNNNYFYLRRRPNAQQASIVMRRGLTGEEEVLVDPAGRSEPGNEHGFVSVDLIDISENCKWLAYGVRVGGSHQQSVEILDLETRLRHPWSLPTGFLRSFIFEKEYTARYIHEDGAAQRPYLRQEVRQRLLDGDYQKIHYIAGESKNLRFLSQYSNDLMLGVYRMIRLGSPKRETIMLLNRRDCGAPMALIADEVEYDVRFQVFPGAVYICTNYNAPNKRICQLDLKCPTLDSARAIVPEGSELIQWWKVARDWVYVAYVRDLVNVTAIWDLEGRHVCDVRYPGGGTADLIGVDDASGEIFVTYQSYNTPPAVFRIGPDGVCHAFSADPARRSAGLGHRGPQVGASTSGTRAIGALGPAPTIGQAPSAPLEIRRCMATAPDGVAIPYTLLGSAATLARENAPTILTGYGGNGVALTPQYSVFAHVWADCGGIFVVANLRGGSEFGTAWHDAAKGRRREVAFQDFRSVAEDLIENRVTVPERLGIAGGSNAGLLVSYAMTAWPERVRAVLCLAPITDLLRFNRQKPEYAVDLGLVEDPEDFRYLLRFSPLHRAMRPERFPALLMISGAKDDICAPYHALKFVAAVQKFNLSDAPILLDFDPMRGHAPYLPLETRVAALAGRLAFMAHELSIFSPTNTERRLPL